MVSISKVLIVEDELISAHNLADNLMELGYDIAGIVKTGKAAIDVVKQNPPDLILMDIQLKGQTSGIDVAQSIQKYQIPVIYLTAFIDDATLHKAARTHPYGYLTKPAKVEDIKSALEMALARSQEDARLRLLAEEEKRLNELKSNFFAMLAHDLRTPLSVMLASLEIVCQYGEQLSDAKKQKHFGQMRAAIRQMTQQLETVMAAEKMAQGSLILHPQPVDVEALLQEAIDSFQPVLLTGQTLQCVSTGEPCVKLLDLVLLEADYQ
jgi:CheY-like chemotaxis protein